MDKNKDSAQSTESDAEQNTLGISIAQLESFERAYFDHFHLELFPIKERDKIPMTKNGFKNATKDLEDYRKLHGRKPHNIGMPTGPVNGLFVLDVDPRHGGNETMDYLVKQYGAMPHTWQARTQSGGTHYFFKWDERRPVTNRANVLPGIDIRGEGGYVLLPPSRVEGVYEWLHSPSKTTLQPAPEWLYLLLGNSSQKNHKTGMSQFAKGLYDGERNVSFTKIIGHLLGHDVDYELAWALVRSFNRVQCNPPLDVSELEKTFVSIAKREVAKRERRRRGRTA